MKRLILILIIALALVPAASAEGNRLLKLEEGEYLRDLITDGATLYAVCDDALYACAPGDEALSQWKSDIRMTDADGAEEAFAHGFYDIALFFAEGAPRGVRCVNDDPDGLQALQLFDLVFTDHGTVEAGDARTLDVPADLRDVEWFSVERACMLGDTLYLLGQVDMGCLLCVMDVNDPRGGHVERLSSWDCGLIATPDGALLTERDYTKERLTVNRVRDDGSLDELCALPTGLAALAADPSTGALFGALDGKAVPVDLDAGEVGEAVAVLPTQPRRGAVLDGGRVYATDVGANIALMDTDGQVNDRDRLSIVGVFTTDWMQNAVVDFSVAHPELPPMMNTDYVARDQLLDAMLTQSQDVDVYLLDSTASGGYQAMRERGFMLPLTGSEALSALGDRMYPALRDACSRDGALVALPVSAYGSCMGIDERLLEKLGLSIADVPGDWLGFLNFLEDEIRPRLSDLGENDRLTYDGMTAEYFSFLLRASVLNDFYNASAATGDIPDYECPELVAILEKLDEMDFTEYGLEQTEEESYGYVFSSDQAYLIQPEIGIDLGGASIASTPLILDIGNIKGVLPLQTTVAFINPYSAHPEAALEFVEALAERMPDQVRYMLCPDLNEPVRWPDADKNLAEYEDEVARQRQALEDAEPANRQAMEEELGNLEQWLEKYKAEDMWMIQADHLARYREYGDRLAMAVPSWFDQDASGEAWELLEQYRDGTLRAREFLAAVNRKARMMAMEG